MPEQLFNTEAQKYIDKLSALHSKDDLLLIDDFAHRLEVGDESLFVLIPCYIEELGLRESLNAYVESGIPDKTMFVVFINGADKIDAEQFQSLLDQRLKEVEDVREAFGNTRLVSLSHHFDSKPTLSRVRGLITDAVVKSCFAGGISDPIIVSNDADAISYSIDYLKNIRTAFDEDPGLDYMSGPISWSGMDEDGFVRYEPYEPLPEIYMSDLLSQIADDIYREQSPVYTTGCNSAYRLSTLCTIGGYDYSYDPYFDVEIGNVLNRFRKAQNANPMKHGRFLQECFLITNPRRAIYAHLENIPYGHQFDTFGTVLGSNIDLASSIALYRKSKLFLQWEELLNIAETKDKVHSRLTAVFMQWLEGELTPYKKTLANLVAPGAGIAIDTIDGAEQKIESLKINWQTSPLLSVLENWAERYRES